MFSATYKAFDANGTKAYQSDFMLTPRTVTPNGSETVVHHFFAGAKVVDIVDDYAKTLGINRFDMAVDWGWFNPLTKWMFLALDYIYRFVGNYGVDDPDLHRDRQSCCSSRWRTRPTAR